MTREKEQLRQQLELLAELSKTADEKDAPCITSAMCEIYDRLQPGAFVSRSALLFVILSDLLVHLVILIH